MSKFIDLVDEAKKIAVISHINPDGDALCSCLAVRRFIENNLAYKAVDVFVDGEIGSLYDPVLRTEGINPVPFKSYDLAIVLDCPNTSRTGKYENIIKESPVVINIDHHETNEKFGDLVYVLPKASSTCEIIYMIAKSSGLHISNIVARQIYQGIITDTNCFSSYSITKKTHEVLSELMNYKFDHDAIKAYYFKNNSIAKTKLFAKAMSTMKFYCNDKFSTMKITNDMLVKLDANFEDTLGIIDSGNNVAGIEASVILIEKEPGKIYVSLRGKGKVNVGEVAKNFGGGGSTTVAAFQAEGDLKELEKRVVDEIAPGLSEIQEEDNIIV